MINSSFIHPQKNSSLDTEFVIPDGLEWDCYILRYPAGAYIPLHVDELPAGDTDRVHRRLNAIVTGAESGGLFQFETNGNLVEKLNPAEGDAVVRF